MRRSAFVAVILAAMAAFAPRPAMAAYNLPWCAQYFDKGSILSCAFASLQQCVETVRGIGGYCRPNYRYAFYPPYPPNAEPRRTRRHNPGYH